jgi:hypothetical protein
MNAMVNKRQQLKKFIHDTLKVHDDFVVVDRLREATFKSQTRQERTQVMGDPTKYCEVLWSGVGEGTQIDSVGDSVLDGHLFRVNLWYQYHDDERYEFSSQKVFDDICEADDGLLKTLRNTDIIQGEELIYLYQPTSVEITEVSLDGQYELAHFLTFTISLR